MVNQTEIKDNRVLAIIAAVAGILCFTILPFASMRAMDAVLKGAALKLQVTGNPMLASAPKIVITFWPLWGGLSVAAGVVLLYNAWALHKGEHWARPMAIGLLAIPSITGAYFAGPIIFFDKSAILYFLIISFIGLVPYFTILLWGHAPAGEKWRKFLIFLLLGVVAAWSFSNGGSALRMFMARSDPYGLTTGHYGFLFGIPVVWIGVLLTIVSIPLLAAYSQRGRRLAVVGLMITLVGSALLFVTNPATTEFLIGMVLVSVNLVLLMIPSIGGRLVREKTYA